MFSNNGVSVNNVLRSFRSHKNLKSQLRIEHLQDGEQYQQLHTPVHHQRPVPNVAHHPRRPSEASSIDTLNSDASYTSYTTYSPSRPSVSSRRVGSVDINPLRLHPPTEDLFVPPHTSLRSPPRHHYERNHVGSSVSTGGNDSMDIEHPTPNFRELQRQRGASLEIYDGFDFGFDNNGTPAPGRATIAAAGTGDGYFGIPVQPKSHWSRSPTPTPRTGDDEDEEMEDPDETPGAGPAPHETDWSAQTSQSTQSTPSKPRCRPVEGLDSPEYFMKRGDWKRRGIVFDATVPLATEEETFDLEG